MTRSHLIVGGVFLGAVATTYTWAYFGGRKYGGGRGSETFFSPDTLELKTRSELRDPLFGQVIYRSSFQTGGRYQLVDFLIQKGYWAPQYPAEPRWVWIYGWNDRSSLGYGSLARQLSRNGEYWIKWTERNPDFAAWLWPRVLEQLRESHDSSSDGFIGDFLSTLKYSRSTEEFALLWREHSPMCDRYSSPPMRARWELPTNLPLETVP